MGAVSFLEDNVERYFRSSLADTGTPPAIVPSPTTRGPQISYCPLCPESFLDEGTVERHIAKDHGRQHVYLKVNGRIVRDICWIAQPLSECKLVLLQIPELQVTFDVGGKVTHCVLHKTGPLKPHLPSIPQEGRICIRTGDPFSKTFTIYLGRQPTFEAHRLDTPLTALMQLLQRDVAVDLMGFREKCEPGKLNELETRYLNGVLEYCHAYQLEVKDEHLLAKDRLEASMDLLMPFKTPLADELRYALSLKMNCFAGQWGCDVASPFRVAERFFCLLALQGEENSSVQTRLLQVPLDPISRSLLEALEAYYKNDDLAALGVLLELRKGRQIRGRNDEAKLALLEARTKERTGGIQAATADYESLSDHPIFGEEAKQHLARLLTSR